MSAFDLASVEADPKLLRDGVWFEIWREPDTTIGGRALRDGPLPDKPCVLIVPLGFAYQRALEEAREPYLERLRARAATDADMDAMQGQALAKAVFRGMVNLSVGDEVLAWTEAKAAELMTDPKWIRLREFVQAAAMLKAVTAAREEAQASKN